MWIELFCILNCDSFISNWLKYILPLKWIKIDARMWQSSWSLIANKLQKTNKQNKTIQFSNGKNSISLNEVVKRSLQHIFLQSSILHRCIVRTHACARPPKQIWLFDFYGQLCLAKRIDNTHHCARNRVQFTFQSFEAYLSFQLYTLTAK